MKSAAALVILLALRIADCGLRRDCGFAPCSLHAALRNPQPAIRNPQSNVRSPQSAIRNESALRNPRSAIADSLFNLDAMATMCQILDGPAQAGRHQREDNLWTFELPDGRGMRRAMAFMTPFIEDKARWPYRRDVQYHDEWPMRHAALLFGGLTLGKPDYIDLWKMLKADSHVEEVIRNFFVRQPVLWID